MTHTNKKLIIFDFDGTLVDSMEQFADIAADVIHARYGTPVKTARRKYVETSGLPFCEQLEELFPNDERNIDAVDEFETRKLDGYFARPIYADARPTLQHLCVRGILTAVSSNNFQHLVDEFVQKNLLMLDFSLGYKSAEFCKGATHFQYLMNVTGLGKDELLFVGDSLKDGETAGRFGIDFIGKTGLFTKEEFKKRLPACTVISSLKELEKIL